MQLVGGWGEADPARTERTQPGGRFVPSVRAARSVIHVESGMKWLSGPLPFSLLPPGPFPFSLENISVGACLSKSEQI